MSAKIEVSDLYKPTIDKLSNSCGRSIQELNEILQRVFPNYANNQNLDELVLITNPDSFDLPIWVSVPNKSETKPKVLPQIIESSVSITEREYFLSVINGSNQRLDLTVSPKAMITVNNGALLADFIKLEDTSVPFIQWHQDIGIVDITDCGKPGFLITNPAGLQLDLKPIGLILFVDGNLATKYGQVYRGVLLVENPQ